MLQFVFLREKDSVAERKMEISWVCGWAVSVVGFVCWCDEVVVDDVEEEAGL